MDLPRYYLLGILPIKLVPTPEGGMTVLRMSWESLAFEYGNEHLDRLMLGTGDVERVTEDEFIQHVESLRARRYAKDDALGAVYQVINGFEDVAMDQGRPMTDEEVAMVATLRRETYQRFRAAYPDP